MVDINLVNAHNNSKVKFCTQQITLEEEKRDETKLRNYILEVKKFSWMHDGKKHQFDITFNQDGTTKTQRGRNCGKW